MLAVHRKQPGAVLRRGPRYQCAGRDERFLVGKRHRLSAFKRGNHRRQTRKTDNPGDDNIDRARQRRAGGLAYDDFDLEPASAAVSSSACASDASPTVSGRCRSACSARKAGMGPGHEDLNVELVRAGFDKREGAGTDRSRRPK